MRALLIENDPETLSYFKQRLEEKCYAIDTTMSGQSAIHMAKSNDYDIIISEFNFSDRDGFCICGEIRNYNHDRRSRVPMIMTTTNSDTAHIIEALNCGYDDCMKKPFLFDELYARIQALLRRPNLAPRSVLMIDNLVLDTNTQRIVRNNKPIYLTKKEFSLLEFLLQHKGCVVSRNTISEKIWDIHCDALSNTIEMHVLNLRRKIDLPGYIPLIYNIPGRGYKIDTER